MAGRRWKKYPRKVLRGAKKLFFSFCIPLCSSGLDTVSIEDLSDYQEDEAFTVRPRQTLRELMHIWDIEDDALPRQTLLSSMQLEGNKDTLQLPAILDHLTGSKARGTTDGDLNVFVAYDAVYALLITLLIRINENLSMKSCQPYGGQEGPGSSVHSVLNDAQRPDLSAELAIVPTHSDSIDDSMSGTAAMTLLGRDRTIYAANTGDSRAVIAEERGEDLVAVDLSIDQTPYRTDELERDDPSVQYWGTEEADDGDPPRLWVLTGMFSGTASTRNIGDSIGETVGAVATPEIVVFELKQNHPYFVISSDCVFEFLSSQTVVDMLVAKFKDPRDACAAIVAESYELWLQFETRTDDITIVVIHVNGLTEDQVDSAIASRDEGSRALAQMVEMTGSLSPSTIRWNSWKNTQRMRHDLSRARLKALETSLENGHPWVPSPPSHRKTWKEEIHIQRALHDHFLFRKLTESESQVLLDCMRRLEVNLGDIVVQQGEGDCFYVVGGGEFEVLETQSEPITSLYIIQKGRIRLNPADLMGRSPNMHSLISDDQVENQDKLSIEKDEGSYFGEWGILGPMAVLARDDNKMYVFIEPLKQHTADAGTGNYSEMKFSDLEWEACIYSTDCCKIGLVLVKDSDIQDSLDHNDQILKPDWKDIFRMNHNELEEGETRILSRDTTIDPRRTAYLIQNLMTSRWIAAQQKLPLEKGEILNENEVPGCSPSFSDAERQVFGCEHYKRNCKLLAVCCKRLFTCRFCHDNVSGHSVDRKATTEMMCVRCLKVQPIGPNCKTASCQDFQFAKYCCSISNFFDDERSVYHCPLCNLCHFGNGLGTDFFHCMVCNCCLGMKLSEYICRESSLETNCPICCDFLVTSRAVVRSLPCGHFMHSACFQEFTCSHYTCTICSKSLGDIAVYFGMLDALLAAEEEPEEYRNSCQDILCNDCGKKGLAWFRWLYHKCGLFGS